MTPEDDQAAPETPGAGTPDLEALEAEARRLSEAGRHEAAAQLRAWRDLHALRVARDGR